MYWCRTGDSMITVIMSAYFPTDVPARQRYAVESLGSLLEHLYASEGLRLHIADDSEEPMDIIPIMMQLAEQNWPSSSYSNSCHGGIGASLNTALRHIDQLWMYTTDDWVLTQRLDLDGPVQLLRMGYDLVRLGPVHPDLQCVTRFQAGLGWWLDLLPSYGGFAFATRPFLARKEFYEKIGPFDEGLNSYETERLYADRVARSNTKLAYWGGIDLAGPWTHVGEENVGYREICTR